MSTPALSRSGQAYQAELEHKLAQAQAQAPTSGYLGLRLHGLAAGLPLAQAGEVVKPVPLQRLPHTQPWVLGVAGLRGSLWLVLDWVRMLALTPPAVNATPAASADEAIEYWVALNPALGLNLALRAEQLLGLRRHASVADASAPLTAPAALRLPSAVIASNQPWLELNAGVWSQSERMRKLLIEPFDRVVRPLKAPALGLEPTPGA